MTTSCPAPTPTSRLPHPTLSLASPLPTAGVTNSALAVAVDTSAPGYAINPSADSPTDSSGGGFSDRARRSAAGCLAESGTGPADRPSVQDRPLGLAGAAGMGIGPLGSGGRGDGVGVAKGGAGGDDRDRLARAGLSRVVEPGDVKALEVFDGMDACEIWELLRRRTPGTERWSSRLAEAEPERDLERATEIGARFVIPGDEEWPEQIEVLAEAGQLGRRAGVPFGLWVRGPLKLRAALDQSVAVVGSRASSSYGEYVAAEFSSGIADKGLTVVSGGAFGIDAAAHRAVLAASGATIAVLACGVDKFYPRQNSALLSRIAEHGMLVSELPPGCTPTRLRFLARNRLIAASTLGVVVIEAATRSGALNSAGWAEQCGRAVLAVPGPITSRMSEGSHLLVRERGAVLVTSVAEVLEAVSPIGTHLTARPTGPSKPFDQLDHDIRRTLDAVPVRSSRPASQVASEARLDLQTTQDCLETLAELSLVEHNETGWRLATPITPPTPDPNP